jgi:hypothetical protein
VAIVFTFAAFGVAALLLGSESASGEESGGAATAAPLRVYDPGDGGPIYLGDPPGELRPSDDPSPSPAPQAAEPADAGPAAESADVRQLRGRVAALERLLAQPRNDDQSELLWQLNEQLAGVRDQLSRAQAGQVATQMAAYQSRMQLQRSVVTLGIVQERLAYGDSQVIDALDAATPALPFPAQGLVRDARAAVREGDLASARYWLTLAIGEAQRAQLLQ